MLRALLLVAVVLVPFAAERARACATFIHKLPPKPPADVEVTPPLPPTPGTTIAVIAYDDQKQTTTLIPEVKGEIRKFAMLIPVAGKVTKSDLKVLSDEAHYRLLFDTKPELEIVRDVDPCVPESDDPASGIGQAAMASAGDGSRGAGLRLRASDYGVAVEGHFEVGEYELALLSAKDAKGLGKWLRKFKYQVDAPVEAALGDALGNGFKILVARVHLKKLLREQFSTLRPLQIRTRLKDAPLLPLAVSAAGGVEQEVIVVALAEGRAELASHPMLEMPTGWELPVFIKDDFDDEYTRFVKHWFQSKAGAGHAALLEFSGPSPTMNVTSFGAKPGAFLTRWRVRVTPDSPDLVFRPTTKRTLYRSHFVSHEPWQPISKPSCFEGRAYLRTLSVRLGDQAERYEALSGAPASKTVSRFQERFPLAFKKWHEPKKKLVVSDEPSAPPPPSFFDSWWKYALGLFGFVVGLIVIGRIRRG